MAIDTNRSSIFRAVAQVQTIPTNLFFIVRQVSFSLLAAAALLWAANELARLLPAFVTLPSWLVADRYLLAAAIELSFAFWAPSYLMLVFVDQKLKRQGKVLGKNFDTDENLLEYLNFKAARVFRKTFSMDHLPFERLLFYLILSSSEIDFSLKRLNIDRAVLKKQLLDSMKERSKMFSRDNSALVKEMNRAARQRVMEAACKTASERASSKVTIFDLFLVLVDSDKEFQRMMDSLELLKEDVVSVFAWQGNLEAYREFRKRFWERDNLRLLFPLSPVKGAVGGWTVTLDRYSHDMTLYNPLRQGGVVLHQREIEQLEETLVKRNGNGVLLVGAPGSGRRSVVFNLANRIASESGPAGLQAARILELDMVALMGNNPDKATMAEILGQVFAEAVRAKNVVLVISQINNFLGGNSGSDQLAAVDITGVISRYLKLPGFRLIGICTYEGYHRSIEQAGETAPLFRKIEVTPVSAEETLKVLKEEVLRREKNANFFIPLATLKEVVKLCDFFLG
ncbi:MAG: hypothetical protein MUD10_05635, partial [Candidatus Pacebacteria bacterium]|nr:hypothetical protein [Candidatus Paceibacterota bacterium]